MALAGHGVLDCLTLDLTAAVLVGCVLAFSAQDGGVLPELDRD